ncbi:MAG: hypothetical protein D3925_01305, partial [Candidatus Electrothrix sp. AR5]|nr:hypothetical protein [Candidatus Electrothrix sp. AR5]
MKILFVNHDISHYGAATSLSLMLRNNSSLDFDMIVPQKGKYEEEDIRSRFNLRDGKLFFHKLSLDMSCYVGGFKKRITFKERICKKIEERKFFISFLYLAIFGRYDLVYINSIVLYRYITKYNKTLIHIRERYEKNGKPVLEYINKASGVIFIDNATFSPFTDSISTKYKIINNPFDMTGLDAKSHTDNFEHFD